VKVLLDENLPHKLRAALAQHEVLTVVFLGWGGLKNGALLKAAEAAKFDVFITGDRALEYQQHLASYNLAVLSLSSNNWPIIKNYVAEIAAAIEGAVRGTCTRVECGSAAKPPKS
jgi:hypothetical protein